MARLRVRYWNVITEPRAKETVLFRAWRRLSGIPSSWQVPGWRNLEFVSCFVLVTTSAAYEVGKEVRGGLIEIPTCAFAEGGDALPRTQQARVMSRKKAGPWGPAFLSHAGKAFQSGAEFLPEYSHAEQGRAKKKHAGGFGDRGRRID